MNPSWRKQIFLFLGMLVILVMAFGAVLTAKDGDTIRAAGSGALVLALTLGLVRYLKSPL
jgi:hypothetical protein